MSIRSELRQESIQSIQNVVWDYVIIGGGITGAQAFKALAQTGAKVLLLDASDFSQGTSSQSGMLVWGGSIYLRQGHVGSVIKFSNSRDKMIQENPENVAPIRIRYLLQNRSLLTEAGIYLYWLLGGCRRRIPRLETQFSEQKVVKRDYKYAYSVEEGILRSSDARFVLDTIFESIGENSKAVNYLELVRGTYQDFSGRWALEIEDRITNHPHQILAKHIINCAGVATETIHDRLGGIKSPYKHVWSKGVYLCLKLSPH